MFLTSKLVDRLTFNCYYYFTIPDNDINIYNIYKQIPNKNRIFESFKGTRSHLFEMVYLLYLYF